MTGYFYLAHPVKIDQIAFYLPHDAMLARYMLSSVRPSHSVHTLFVIICLHLPVF